MRTSASADPSSLVGRIVISALVAVVAVGFVAAMSAHGASAASSAYATAPSCSSSLWRPAPGPRAVCGPWSVSADPANPFVASFGQCVYWAIEKRPDIWSNRSPLDPNPYDWDAWTWADHARAEGLAVDGVPQPGDVVIWSQRQASDAAGHVAFVEAVNPGRGITITEMNGAFGSRGGDWRILSPRPLAAGLGGWKGLRFIHQPGAAAPVQSPQRHRMRIHRAPWREIRPT